MQLNVVKEGFNWVVVANATVTFEGTDPLKDNGVLFVTLQEDVAEFHTKPRQFLHESDDKSTPVRRPAPMTTTVTDSSEKATENGAQAN